MEELQARHRKEQKELQGKITSKKKNATKKTRKGVNDECERLEHELKARQAAEIATLAPTSLEENLSEPDLNEENGDAQQDAEAESADTLPTQASAPPSVSDSATTRAKKPNRQQARLERRRAEQQAQIEAAAQEAAAMPDQRQQELSAMLKQMESRGLTETMIRPDGHCLYSACAHTLPSDQSKDYRSIRKAAADYILAHSEDFAPFMDEPVPSYTRKITDTAEWGGHLELQAIAKSFGTNINVLHATGHVDTINPEQPTDNQIWLAYYQHSFGLGEHYNALQKSSSG